MLIGGENMHRPVLLQEVINYFNIKAGGLYIDATFGEGNHSAEILARGGKVLGIEWDFNQYKRAKIKNQRYITQLKKLILIKGNFKNIEQIAKQNNFYPVDGVLFDLGLSMWQLEKSGRGFSFKKLSEPLDMRLSDELKNKASDLINSLSPKELYEILATYSEEVNSWSIVKTIIRTRSLKKIKLVGDLISVINKAIRKKDEKVYRRVFQALRIAVNKEFENLEKGLEGALNLIKKEGRIMVIAFHSLEDRLVKRFVYKNNLTLLTKKPVTSRTNLSFERSAKLRVISWQ